MCHLHFAMRAIRSWDQCITFQQMSAEFCLKIKKTSSETQNTDWNYKFTLAYPNKKSERGPCISQQLFSSFCIPLVQIGTIVCLLVIATVWPLKAAAIRTYRLLQTTAKHSEFILLYLLLLFTTIIKTKLLLNATINK